MSPVRICREGHKYPETYTTECNYCVAVYGYKTNIDEIRKQHKRGKDKKWLIKYMEHLTLLI